MSEGFPQPPTPEYNAEPDPYHEELEKIGTTGTDGESTELPENASTDNTSSMEPPPTVGNTPSGLLTDESMLPPEARGETNGGPLGCCLGVIVGLFLSLSIAVIGRLYSNSFATVFHGNLSLIVRIVMALVAVIAAIIFGIIGWKIGKRVYKEYEMSPRQQRKLAELQQKQHTRQRRASVRNTHVSAPSKHQ